MPEVIIADVATEPPILEVIVFPDEERVLLIKRLATEREVAVAEVITEELAKIF